jgi:hypothetical protein
MKSPGRDPGYLNVRIGNGPNRFKTAGFRHYGL